MERELPLTGVYADKQRALEILESMGVNWNMRQIELTAEPDAAGNRKWPWFRDEKGILRIDEGFIRSAFHDRQLQALKKWQQMRYTP